MFGIFKDFPIVGDLVRDVAGDLLAGDRQADAQAFAGAQSDANRAFQERMRATQYQTAVKDLEAAGLNPMLAYHNGGAGTPTGGIASAGIASPTPGNTGTAASMQSASQIAVNDAQAEKLKAEAREIEARTPTHAVNIDKLRQDIEHSKTSIDKMIQETATSASSARNIDQQTRNLQESIHQIRALVEQTKALTKLHGAHTTEAGARTTVSDATYDEIRQRTKVNLPQLEAALKALEQKAKELAMPGRGMDAAASNSIIGAWRAAIRAITGQQAQGGN